jgi:hypothetical protein
MTTTNRELGSLTRGVRRRGAMVPLSGDPAAAAARLRAAYDDAVAGRNGIPVTREELWALAGLEPE